MSNLSSKKKYSIFENKTIQDNNFSLSPQEYAMLKFRYEEYQQTFKLLNHWQEITFQDRLESPLISYMFQSQMEHAKRIIEPSFLALLCDIHGVISSYASSQDVSSKFHETGMKVGTSLALKYAGINAVSASMAFNKPVFIRYKDHSLSIFEDWACMCVPIVNSKGSVLGYFDFSTYCSVEVKRYIPLCFHIAKAIGSYMPLEDYLQKKN